MKLKLKEKIASVYNEGRSTEVISLGVDKESGEMLVFTAGDYPIAAKTDFEIHGLLICREHGFFEALARVRIYRNIPSYRCLSIEDKKNEEKSLQYVIKGLYMDFALAFNKSDWLEANL